MFELIGAEGELRYAYHPDECRRLAAAWSPQADAQPPMVRSVRGLGGFSPATLQRLCVAPATRHAHALTPGDVATVIEVFGTAGGRARQRRLPISGRARSPWP